MLIMFPFVLGFTIYLNHLTVHACTLENILVYDHSVSQMFSFFSAQSDIIFILHELF